MDDSNEICIAYIKLIKFSFISDSNLVHASHSNGASSYQLHDKEDLKKIGWKRKNIKYPEKLLQFCGNQNFSLEIGTLETPYFFQFFSPHEDLINYIYAETRRYSTKKKSFKAADNFFH